MFVNYYAIFSNVYVKLSSGINEHVSWWIQVRVQSDPAGRLIITGQPEQADNPWGITAFKKVCLSLLFVQCDDRKHALDTVTVLHTRVLMR